DADARAALLRAAPDGEEDARARLAWVARDVPKARGLVTIVSAGTSDGPVVTEARVRAQLLGTEVVTHADAGVAGARPRARPRSRTSSAPTAWWWSPGRTPRWRPWSAASWRRR